MNAGGQATEPSDKYLIVNGRRLHYLDWGNVNLQPILLLHGFMAHAHVWDDFAQRVRNQYHVLALDQRGHGETEWSEDGSYSISEHFLDIAGFIEVLGLSDLIVLGHSMGGRNALFYAACSSNQVKQLILADTRPGRDPGSSEALKHLIDHIPLEAGSLQEVVDKLLTLSPYFSREMLHGTVKHGFKTLSNGRIVPKFDIRMIQQLQESNYDTENLWPFLQNITCRSLVIRGTESPFLSKKAAQGICKSIRKAELKEIPNSGHFPALENPVVFHQVITDFLKL